MRDHLMRAVHCYAYGGQEQLVLEQIPRPEPQAGAVLVRVYAAGVNPIDWKIRKGFFKDVRPVPFPFTPGSELAGTVELLGWVSPVSREVKRSTGEVQKGHTPTMR